jgi:hypothetical protein
MRVFEILIATEKISGFFSWYPQWNYRGKPYHSQLFSWSFSFIFVTISSSVKGLRTYPSAPDS